MTRFDPPTATSVKRVCKLSLKKKSPQQCELFLKMVGMTRFDPPTATSVKRGATSRKTWHLVTFCSAESSCATSLCFSLSLRRGQGEVSTNKKRTCYLTSSFLNGRDDTIWTCDPLVPSEVRYQAALHPDIQFSNFLERSLVISIIRLHRTFGSPFACPTRNDT